MTDRKPPKTGADRMRELRERRKAQPVDNVTETSQDASQIVTDVTRMRDEIVALLSEIVTLLRDSSTPRDPSKGGPGVESSIPVTRHESDVTRDAKRDDEKRVWTNSFTTRPGEIPRCPDCKHLIVNCQCEWEQRQAREKDNGFHPSQLRQDLQ